MNLFQLLPLLLVLLLSSSPELGGSSAEVMDRPTRRIRCLEVERKALLKFKDELVDTDGRLSSWGDQENRYECCKWIGVHCHNKTNHVTRLDLRRHTPCTYRNICRRSVLNVNEPQKYYSRRTRAYAKVLIETPLQGTISTSLLELQHLTYLDLSFNDFLGAPIPEFISSLNNLRHLNLASANFSGPLPHHLGNLSKLHSLDLSYNSISGSLPNMSRFSLLKELDLRSNQLNGSIQEGYLHLPCLLVLDLSNNQFMGIVPDLSFSSSLKELHLQSNSLEGTITEAHMSNLSRLWDLDLSDNSLKGTITKAHLSLKFKPHWVPPFQLQRIILRGCNLGPYFPQWLKTQKQLFHIDISSSGISYIIPSWFGGIASRLEYLNISNNQIHGEFPEIPFHSQDLGVEFDLSNNSISGSATFLCYTTEWELLDLSDNMFSGQIPDCFSTFHELQSLNLENNHFSGEISNLFGSACSLTFLHLRNNSFSGGFPISLSNCIGLKMIDLGENRLTGTIPDWLGSLSELVFLILRSNELNGSIPSSLCGLANIQILDLSSNKIAGVIPKSIGNFTTMTKPNYHSAFLIETAYVIWKGKEIQYPVNQIQLVKIIDLSSNYLEDEIPSNITALVGLVELNLSRNNLTGFIPKNIGQLASLNSLDLSRNHLHGGIPTSLSELNSLGAFDLSYNNLSGRIPRSGHALTFDRSSYIENDDLCGEPLYKSCPGDEAHHSSPMYRQEQDDDDDDDDELITKGFYVAIVLGFIFGFWGIFGAILLNKELRYAFFGMLNNFGDFVFVRVELTKAHLRRHPPSQ